MEKSSLFSIALSFVLYLFFPLDSSSGQEMGRAILHHLEQSGIDSMEEISSFCPKNRNYIPPAYLTNGFHFVPENVFAQSNSGQMEIGYVGKIAFSDLKESEKSYLYERLGDSVGRDLSGLDLSGENFKGESLVFANFSGANLRNANLRNTNLVYANFQGANLQGANLSGSKIIATNFEGADLTGAKIKPPHSSELGQIYEDIQCSNFANATLINADIISRNLYNVNFSNANLEGANFLRQSNITYVNFEGANLSNANVEDMFNWGYNLDYMNLTGANLGN